MKYYLLYILQWITINYIVMVPLNNLYVDWLFDSFNPIAHVNIFTSLLVHFHIPFCWKNAWNCTVVKLATCTYKKYAFPIFLSCVTHHSILLWSGIWGSHCWAGHSGWRIIQGQYPHHATIEGQPHSLDFRCAGQWTPSTLKKNEEHTLLVPWYNISLGGWFQNDFEFSFHLVHNFNLLHFLPSFH